MSGRFEDMVAAEVDRAAASGRALVVVDDRSHVDSFDCFSGLRASFLAHLIATRDRLPQTLVLRRASSETAVSVYGAVGGSPHRRRSLMA